MTKHLTKGKLYRLGVERPRHGVGSKNSHNWQNYIPRAALYRNIYTERELFAGLGNKDMIGEAFRNDLVIFLEQTDSWIRLLVDDRVGWLKKTKNVGYRVALCPPDTILSDEWLKTQEGSIISWKRTLIGVEDFLLPERQ